MLVATVSCPTDPFDPLDTLCAQNNAAALSIAALRPDTPTLLTISGTDDTDGLIIWHDDPTAEIEVLNLPITALPWRDAAMFQVSGARTRPLYGDLHAESDPVVSHAVAPKNAEAITAVTDVTGAQELRVEGGCVSVKGRARLVFPRLRIAEGTMLTMRVVSGNRLGDLHALHLSGGRRVGGCTIISGWCRDDIGPVTS